PCLAFFVSVEATTILTQGGKPLFVICDIEKEYQVIEVDGQRFITKCKWNVIPDSANKEV
ncbi:hypothetical protein, partial [Microbulbifer thermotolerans]